jgi:hypothetical protein
MNSRRRIALTVVVWIAVILSVYFFVAMAGMGDCYPEVTDCGEGPRRASFMVLAFGTVGLAYKVYLLLRHRS